MEEYIVFRVWGPELLLDPKPSYPQVPGDRSGYCQDTSSWD